MKVTIIVGEIQREYTAGYDRLHNKEWNDVVREMLDHEKDLKDNQN